ncbi:MAG: CglB [Myxococcaceae bacterium]|nr:CglB [Myxococcaceae bacterium]
MGRITTLALSLALLSGACSTGGSVVGGPTVGAAPVDAGEPDVTLSFKDDFGSFRQPDAIPIRNADVSCGGTAASLTRRHATALLLIDRSGSMLDRDTAGMPKWQALLQSLHQVLPLVDSDLSLGLITFPTGRPDAGLTAASSCEVSTALEVEPALGGADRILRLLDADGPNGNTPTFSALDAAGRWFTSQPDLQGERYVILATDGGPNCNPGLAAGCRCTAPSCVAPNFSPQSCLDGDRTVRLIEALRRGGVQTYVVGLEGVEEFVDVLDAMAVAGGRPRTATPRYYSARSAEELVREFGVVTSAVVGCSFRLDAPPPDPTLVDLRLDGQSLVYDVRQVDGWDWATEEHREIRFHGRTCDLVRAATGGSRLVAAFGCPAPVPP